MFFDSNSPRASTTLLAFNGELIGNIVEADSSAGYVVQVRYKMEPEYTGETSALGDKKWHHYNSKFGGIEQVRLEGRVDVIGDTELDSHRVRFDRLNKVRSELNLSPIPETPFVDEK
jgi:hypothetical protein